jgi:hypothetical protein
MKDMWVFQMIYLIAKNEITEIKKFMLDKISLSQNSVQNEIYVDRLIIDDT